MSSPLNFARAPLTTPQIGTGRMKKTNRLLLLTALAIIFSFSATSQADNLLNLNLLKQQKYLREVETVDALLEMENQELAKLTPAETASPKEAITRKQAQNLLRSISPHPVVGQRAYDSYNRSPTEIGYCFGRATYVHLALLRMGVRKDAIKKIWTVGETGGAMNWIYHVATAVRTTDGNWTVIDNFVGRLITAQEWAAEMRKMTVDGKKATFITDAKKFHPGTGTYSRTELGLHLSRETDFYKHYFADLFKWFGSIESHKYFSSYGVTKVTGEPLTLPARLQPRSEPTRSMMARAIGAICRPLRFSDIFTRSI